MGAARDHRSPSPAPSVSPPRAPSPHCLCPDHPASPAPPVLDRPTSPAPNPTFPSPKPRPRAPRPRRPRDPAACAPNPQSQDPKPQTPPPLAPSPGLPRAPRSRRPQLLTGGSRSRCRESRSPAQDSRAAAGLRPGRGRGSRWPAPTRRGSSTPRAEAGPASSCAAARRDPESRAGGQSGAHRRPDRTRGPRREPSERAGERAERRSELEMSGGAPTPLRAAFSNSARWALRRQRGRGAFSLTLGGPGPRRRQWRQSWGSSSAGGPGSRAPRKPDLVPGSPNTRSLEPSQPNPLRVASAYGAPTLCLASSPGQCCLIPTALLSI